MRMSLPSGSAGVYETVSADTSNPDLGAIDDSPDLDQLRTERAHGRIRQLISHEAPRSGRGPYESRVSSLISRQAELLPHLGAAAQVGGEHADGGTAAGELRQIIDAAGRVPYPKARRAS